MKICMIQSTPFPPEEGIGYYTFNLSKTLIGKGHEIIILTRSSNSKIQKREFNGIKVIGVPYIPLYPIYLYLHGYWMKKVFKSLEPEIDIVHFHTPLPPFIKTNLPSLITIHTPMLTDYRLVKIRSIYDVLSKISARIISYPQELKIIQESDIVTTLTNSIANELKKYYLNGKKVIVVGNGVDDNFCTPNKKDIEDNNKNILFVGRIDREKGLFDLVECARYICNKYSDVFFNIVGKGKDFNKLKNKIKQVGLKDRFILFGQIEKDKLIKLYQNATLFVFPSYHEGLPTVLLEAMSCGLPIIATNVRGNRDLISNGENGIIIPSRDPKKMTEAIFNILKDKTLRKNLGINARKTIEEKYTWDAVSIKFLKCYESLV